MAAAAEDKGFDKLLSKNVPAILEKIFLYLDYESLKTCFQVSTTWRRIVTSEPFRKKARLQFLFDISEDEKKLMDASHSGHAQMVQRLLCLGFIDINCSIEYSDDFSTMPLKNMR